MQFCTKPQVWEEQGVLVGALGVHPSRLPGRSVSSSGGVEGLGRGGEGALGG